MSNRHDLLQPSSSQYFSKEIFWNEISRRRLASNTIRAIDVAIVDLQGNQVVPGGSIGGNTTNRVVSLTDATAVAVTPTADTRELHIFNDTGQTLRYGGSGVTQTSGGILFNQGTIVFKNPDSDFSVWFIQSSGGAIDLDVIEFF